MKKALAIVTVALCLLMITSLMPVSAKIIEKKQGDGTEPAKVLPPSDKDIEAAFRTVTVKSASTAATIPTLKTPKLVSPAKEITLYNFPRTILLQWEPVDGATGYIVDKAYNGGGIWYFYPSETVTGAYNTFYSFDFIGDQPGAWRVTAVGDATHANSNPSAFRMFYYSTGMTLSTPKLVSPVNNSVFSNYPRMTQLTWKPVPGATGYEVQVEYDGMNGGGAWTPWVPNPLYDGIANGVFNADYIFNFVGAQPGRMRVRAVDTTDTLWDSSFSNWRYFKYTR